jgi:hypothetical protein
MTSRAVTLGGYAVIALLAIGLEVVARKSGRFATLGDVLAHGLRRWPCRTLLQAGWLWLGWHLFVRTHW